MTTDVPLALTADAVDLTVQLVDIESVSRNEQAIADAVAEALRGLGHLEVTRHGHTVVARTELGRGERVVIAGHLDTVPVNDNLPARRDGELLHGLGTCDMKGGDAVILRLAATVPEPRRDVTYILYEAEEIDSEFNGLNLLSQSHPALMEADFAILMEPSNAEVEAGCQGTLRVEVGWLHPRVGRGDDDVVGERAVAVDPHAHRVDAQVAPPGPAVAAGAAHDVALARDPVAHGHVVDVGADLDDLAEELVAERHRHRHGGGSPLVPLLQVQVGAAQAGPQHPQLHVLVAAPRLGHLHELETGTCRDLP